MTTAFCSQVRIWHDRLTPAMEILRHLTGNTEDQFLELGGRLQDFAVRSASISSTAHELVELVAGSDSSCLTERLHGLFSDMEQYLGRVNRQGLASCGTLQQIMEQLDNVVQPLEGFRKMDKALRMLSISTKIESSRLGELGAGFTTLAMDVEKLSQAVNEKSSGIMEQRQALSQLINSNLEMVRTTEANQHTDAQRILKAVGDNLTTLETLNTTCSATGNQVELTSEQIAADIGTVVSSMQFHDISRQQVEHIIEALEKLQQHTCINTETEIETCPALIAETGDVCELQSAQLRHAADQLSNATRTILDSLQDIAAKQTKITFDLQQALMGNASSAAGNSLLESMEQDMREVTQILQRCDLADQELAAAMQKVTVTISEIGGFVSDIEAVGSEIDLIALNAQIKAAHTGEQGAALGVLAEAIKRLSLDAVVQTEAVSTTLQTIKEVTAGMSDQTSQDESLATQQVATMEQEARQVISSLSNINRTLLQQLSSLVASSESLSDEISNTISGVHVHDDVQQQTAQAVQALEQIFTEARAQVPASSEFRNNLQHMEQRYTMESERMIHEMLAARHGVKLSLQKQQNESGSDSEYGDNVDLF